MLSNAIIILINILIYIYYTIITEILGSIKHTINIYIYMNELQLNYFDIKIYEFLTSSQ